MERFLRRSAAMIFGFLVAVGIGAALTPIAALADPILREFGLNAALAGMFSIFADGGAAADPAAGVETLAALLWATTIAVCVAPLAVVALVGEVAGQRGWLWHAAGCGFLAAAAPWIARATHHVASRGHGLAHDATALEMRVATIFFLVGVVSGTVYWAIAARGAKTV